MRGEKDSLPKKYLRANNNSKNQLPSQSSQCEALFNHEGAQQNKRPNNNDNKTQTFLEELKHVEGKSEPEYQAKSITTLDNGNKTEMFNKMCVEFNF